MKNLFVPYEECLELKNLGFDFPCIKFAWDDGMINKGYVDEQDYNRGVCISIPLYQQVFEWLREKFNIDAWSQPFMIENLNGEYFLPDESYSYYIFRDGVFVKDGVDFLDFEEAQLECIRECIKILKNLMK